MHIHAHSYMQTVPPSPKDMWDTKPHLLLEVWAPCLYALPVGDVGAPALCEPIDSHTG